MIGHKIKKYDIHHICLPLAECVPETKFEVLPSTDENYISLSVGVFIKNFESEAGQQVPIFEHKRLIDSFNFMPQSLESLLADLPDNRFDILRFKNETYSNSDFQRSLPKRFLMLFLHHIRTSFWRKSLAAIIVMEKNIA